MASGRYDAGGPGLARSGPSVKRARRLAVDGRGEFAAPARLGAAQYHSMLDAAPETGPAASSARDAFVYDDDLSWEQPLETAAVKKPEPRPVHAAPVPSQGPKRERSEAGGGQPPRKPGGGRQGGRKKPDHPGWRAYMCVAVTALSVLGILVLAVVMMPQMAGYFWRDFGNYAFINGELLRYDPEVVAAYKQYRDYMDRDVIYPGIFVDGIHVGDLTVEEARQLLTANGSDVPNAFSVTVAIGNKTWTVDSSNVPAQRDLGNVLERAYAIGRTNTTAIQSTLQTPFRERTNRAVALRESGINLTTTASYDHEAVRALVADIAAYVTRDPVDAQIQSFDYATRTFSFTESQPGVTLDQDLLYERVTAALDRWESGVTVTVDPIVTEPAVTKDELVASFGLVAAYTTETTNDSNRNTNIDLACQAINGTALMPGETFSFNQATGQRTTEKGYKSAGAIAAGQSIEEVGGGICQVSSTLFNAVARANLEIVSRSPHAWPSTYVNIGEDATVNWPNLDFQFKNNTKSPIFIITYYKNRRMSAEIWGMSLGEGVTIDLQSTIIKTIDPPSEVKYELNTDLPYGTEKTTVKARTGYVVETEKVWYKDGQETRRELLHTSNYRAYQQVIEYNY